MNASQKVKILLITLGLWQLVACSYGDQGQKYSPDTGFSLADEKLSGSCSIRASSNPKSWLALSPATDKFTPLLQKYVGDNGKVDYQKWTLEKTDLEDLRQVVKNLGAVKAEESPRDRLARMINLYNAATLLLIVDRFAATLGTAGSSYPNVRSIRNIDGLDSAIWDQPLFNFEGRQISLNQLESEDPDNRAGLRKSIRAYGDPRIHFVVHCASKGCPKLLNIAVSGALLDEQLDYATFGYVHSGQQTQFIQATGSNPTLQYSQILDWYWADFKKAGYTSVQEFYSRWVDPIAGVSPKELLTTQSLGRFVWQIKGNDYDWTLNQNE